MNINDGPAVVTGGASGLGEATARRLAEAGTKVALLDLDETRGESLAREIGGLFMRTDVADAESVAAALAAARSAHGQERITVNCAGIAPVQRSAGRHRETGEVWAHDPAVFSKVLAVNLSGTFNVSVQSAAGMMTLDPVTLDGGRGVIVNTSSVAAEDGQIGQIAYAASKGAVKSMVLPMARDLARDGIRVVGILPGIFATPMFGALDDAIRDTLAASVPFPQRLGRAEEYAALVQHIVENDMLNGCTIRLDGAIRLAPR